MPLKPCPWCTATPYVFPYVNSRRFQVRCAGCGCHVAQPATSHTQAREDWNNWPGHAPVVAAAEPVVTPAPDTPELDGYRQD